MRINQIILRQNSSFEIQVTGVLDEPEEFQKALVTICKHSIDINIGIIEISFLALFNASNAWSFSRGFVSKSLILSI